MYGYGSARTRGAFGRFLWLLLLTVAGCQTAGDIGPSGTSAPAPPAVVVAPGPITAAEQAEASELLESARRSSEARRHFEVLRTTEDLLARFPASDASGEALRLTAMAAIEVGELERADEAATRYLALLSGGDPRGAEMRLVQAAALASDPAARVARLLEIGPDAGPEAIEDGAEQLREASGALPIDELQALVEAATTRGPLLGLAEARLAVALLERGRAEEATRYATRALVDDVPDEERRWAEGVLEGELPDGRRRVTDFRVAVVLPLGGPPALAEFSRSIREGIEVAAASVLGEGFTLEVEVLDDEGDPVLTAEHVASLEAAGVDGIIGMLLDDALLSAAGARAAPTPLVSPTARSAAQAGEGVYSLEGADPTAAASLAAYAASRAYQRIAMVFPQSPDAEAEANAFADAARQLGMPVVARFTYEPGATFFEPQIIGARNALRQAEIQALGLTEDDTLHVELLEPVAVFLPIPPEDVAFIAPQVVHFGLDTLGIEVLGTSGWTDPPTLATVEPRLTTGVVATAPVSADSAVSGAARFRQKYEEHFQRSLVGDTPAVGYDAMLLLLEALRPGLVGPEMVNASFAALEAVPGATGILSVVDGRVVRRTEIVRIDDRRLVPVVVTPADPANPPR